MTGYKPIDSPMDPN